MTGLCLCCRLLLLSDGSLARSFARAGVGMGALSANRQVAAMTEPAIGADFDETLDVHRNFLAQIAFDQTLGLDDRTDAVNFFFAEVLNLLHRFDLGFVENARRARMPDAINVGQRDVDVLLAGKIHACNTCHSMTPARDLALALFMFRIHADHAHHTFAVDDLALVTDFLYRCSYLHNPAFSRQLSAFSKNLEIYL